MFNNFTTMETYYNDSNNQTNITLDHMPKELIFSGDSLLSVISYLILFIISAIGNLLVLIIFCKQRHSRFNIFIMHLCFADLIVTFIMLPMEIGWHITVSWMAGDIGCRVFMFARAYGFYLSSFIVVAISLDRYFAVVRPSGDDKRRGKIMIPMAWILSAAASTPQVIMKYLKTLKMLYWMDSSTEVGICIYTISNCAPSFPGVLIATHKPVLITYYSIWESIHEISLFLLQFHK